MKELIIASNNKGKIKETEQILNNFKIISIEEKGIKIDIKEDGKTFEENAIKKVTELAKKAKGFLCIADDSGIEIEYLHGFPGVVTKRWFDRYRQGKKYGFDRKIKRCSKRKKKNSI